MSDKHNRMQTMPQFLRWSTPQQQGGYHSDDEVEVHDENGCLVTIKHDDDDDDFHIGKILILTSDTYVSGGREKLCSLGRLCTGYIKVRKYF